MTRSRREAAVVGMILFLGSWAMLFVALLFSYGVVRAGAPAWPPDALAAVPPRLTLGSTVSAVAASVLLARGKAAAAAAAAGLGGVFLWFQSRLVLDLAGAGAELGDPVAAMIFALVGFVAVNAAAGILGLAGAVGLTAWRRRRGAHEGTSLTLWSMFWHAVGAAWLATYLVVFIA